MRDSGYPSLVGACMAAQLQVPLNSCRAPDAGPALAPDFVVARSLDSRRGDSAKDIVSCSLGTEGSANR